MMNWPLGGTCLLRLTLSAVTDHSVNRKPVTMAGAWYKKALLTTLSNTGYRRVLRYVKLYYSFNH